MHNNHYHKHGHDNHYHTHSHNNFHEAREGNKKGLIIALIITAGIMILEFFGGLISNSLALLADSGHMLSDTSSLALSLAAIYFAARPASTNKTYGFYRFEILAALVNGITLFIISIFIFKEAYQRFLNPTEVVSTTMIAIASIGFIANLVSAWFLTRNGDVKGNINLKSAYLHILGDAIGSVGAIIAGVIMLFTGWYLADPIISVLVAILILKSSISLIKQTLHILMEGSPSSINLADVKHTLEAIDGVKNVHDLHVWTISSGFDCLSCHLLINDTKDAQIILESAIRKLEDRFNIKHATIQIEKRQLQHTLFVHNREQPAE